MPESTSVFVPRDWWWDHRVHRTSPLKRSLYWCLRPALSAYHRRALSAATVESLQPDLVLGARGLPLETRFAWAFAGLPRRNDLTLLVQGVGTGWEAVTWAKLRPGRIIATDMVEFRDSWREISAHCQRQFGVSVEFRVAPLEDHSFIESSTIDVCGSTAVFEHCTDLPGVLRETHRLLRPGGRLYASYGPLWFAPGGDHFSGRGGLDSAFNHLLLSDREYWSYFREQKHAVEDFQSGGRYVELALFSKLTTGAYLDRIASAGFRREFLALELSQTARAFARRFPARWRALTQVHPGVTEDDFKIQTNLVCARKL